VSTPGTLVQQYPAVYAGPFSGEHAFVEELRPKPARRRKPGPKKPIISKKMWQCVNTPAVLAGEEFAQTVVERNLGAQKTAINEKMALQMYLRNSERFSVSERAFHRELLETRAGQKRLGTSMSEGGLTSAHIQSQDSLGQSLPKTLHTGASRAEVLPGDHLASLERYSRNPGMLIHEKKSILQNGFLSRDGHREKLQPRFQVDDRQRETRRVITGGTCDRLHYSDGSLAVLLPPKVLRADPSFASKPLILRDGTASTIRARTLPRACPPREFATAGELVMEVPSLSSVILLYTILTTHAQPIARQLNDDPARQLNDDLARQLNVHHAVAILLTPLHLRGDQFANISLACTLRWATPMAGAYCPYALFRPNTGRGDANRGRPLPPKELGVTLVHTVRRKYIAKPGFVFVMRIHGCHPPLAAGVGVCAFTPLPSP
jgi:hypothetical protein